MHVYLYVSQWYNFETTLHYILLFNANLYFQNFVFLNEPRPVAIYRECQVEQILAFERGFGKDFFFCNNTFSV